MLGESAGQPVWWQEPIRMDASQVSRQTATCVKWQVGAVFARLVLPIWNFTRIYCNHTSQSSCGEMMIPAMVIPAKFVADHSYVSAEERDFDTFFHIMLFYICCKVGLPT